MQLSLELKKAIDNNAFTAIATHLSNGEIQNHLMWVDYKDDSLLINTEKGRKKTLNIRENNSITLVVFEPSAMYSSWEIRGRRRGCRNRSCSNLERRREVRGTQGRYGCSGIGRNKQDSLGFQVAWKDACLRA